MPRLVGRCDQVHLRMTLITPPPRAQRLECPYMSEGKVMESLGLGVVQLGEAGRGERQPLPRVCQGVNRASASILSQ